MTRRVLFVCLPALAVAGAFSNTLAQKPVTQGAAITETAIIVAIDSANRLITLEAEDGNTMSFRIEDKKNLESPKAGDQVQITHTRAPAVSVEAPKK